MGWHRFNSQFYETDWERRERRAERKAQLKAEGKCWQCAKLIIQCDCPNICHPAPKAKEG